jgi:hypothetical protein
LFSSAAADDIECVFEEGMNEEDSLMVEKIKTIREKIRKEEIKNNSSNAIVLSSSEDLTNSLIYPELSISSTTSSSLLSKLNSDLYTLLSSTSTFSSTTKQYLKKISEELSSCLDLLFSTPGFIRGEGWKEKVGPLIGINISLKAKSNLNERYSFSNPLPTPPELLPSSFDFSFSTPSLPPIPSVLLALQVLYKLSSVCYSSDVDKVIETSLCACGLVIYLLNSSFYGSGSKPTIADYRLIFILFVLYLHIIDYLN